MTEPKTLAEWVEMFLIIQKDFSKKVYKTKKVQEKFYAQQIAHSHMIDIMEVRRMAIYFLKYYRKTQVYITEVEFMEFFNLTDEDLK